MITKIKLFINALILENESLPTDELSIEMASTVLLCEVMRADGKLELQEMIQLAQIISHRFNLTQDEVELLIKEAMHTSESATDFYTFTSKINATYAIEDKIEMVKHLWLLALADGEVSAIEQHTIRRIADLLHLRQSEYIQAKDIIIDQ
ncbi:TerB family tellurite resistance protein [Thalassotalea piscium]